MQGRGRGQLPVFYKAPTFLLRDSITSPSSIASVTYDDPTGSWESWEPGAGWGSVGGGTRSGVAPSPQAQDPEAHDASHASNDAAKSEPDLRWDEDGDTNLRHPKQLPRTLITTSELDWEDSEECATELWQHPQRRSGRGESGQRMRPQIPDPSRREPAQPEARAARAPANARVNGTQRAPQGAGTNGVAHAQPRSAEPTARWKTSLPALSRAPQQLPKAPPPRAAIEPAAPNERRSRTTTQPGAAQTSSPPAAAALSADVDSGVAAALSTDPRAASALSSLGQTQSFDPRAQVTPPAAARPRNLMQTQVSGFGAAPGLDNPPPPAGRASTAPRMLPAPPPARQELEFRQDATPIESLRKRSVTPRMLPPRPPVGGHIPTILGTPAAGSTNRAAAEPPRPPAPRPQPTAASPARAAEGPVIEQLQEQLLEAMARARVQEARAAEAEKTVEQVEEQLESIVRSHTSEAEQLREELRQTSGQLRMTETRAAEAERRSMIAMRPQQNVLHLAEPELAPRGHKQGRANLILSGLLASSLSFGGAAYFMFYAPLQKQLVALEQQRMQDAQAQSNALTNLKAQTAAERQSLEAQNADLRKQVDAARAEVAALNADDGKRGRSRRSSSADDAEETPPGTRSAKAIERKMRRSRGAAAADGDAAEAPAPARRAGRGGDDPLDGI